MNPYLVLGVPVDADDQVIRQAYLVAVKESPPDLAPQRFQAVSAAYEQIKDAARRRRHFLFNRDCPAGSPLDVLPRYASHQRRIAPLPFDAMKEILLHCAGVTSPKSH
jgi:curved DNA-binding protein CbpA